MDTNQMNVDEILQIAEDIERNGKAFYAAAAAVAKDNNIRKLFLDLAEWEAIHQKTFAKLRAQKESDAVRSIILDSEGEEGKYLKAVANGVVFANLKSPEVLLEDSDGRLDSLIMFAIEREKDSVVFYTSIGRAVNDRATKDMVDKIVGEEISHIRFLAEVLQANK